MATLLLTELANTLYMVLASCFFACLFGLPLGVLLTITSKGHIKDTPWLYKLLDTLVNIGRSFPFAILIVAIIPFTRFIVGTSLGTSASIVPLTVAAIPYIARLVETALKETNREIIEAARVMGSSTWQIITKVLLVEQTPVLIQGLTLTIINLIGYSAMAGMVGGGGLGKVAIQYGYQRFDLAVMSWTVILMILLVQLTQWAGDKISNNIYKKRGIHPR
ncbi:MAG: ABC transporter permease [Verrucomicrobia bacterium]|nr:ABC transporter permease [Verrucomicrobiota bacterium]MBS0637291.1 ABC transporter permease [Verrucomicrobiota bacterium]